MGCSRRVGICADVIPSQGLMEQFEDQKATEAWPLQCDQDGMNGIQSVKWIFCC